MSSEHAPILIVDDSQEDIALAERALQQCKLLNSVIALRSGEACLEWFRTAGKYITPAIVLLDLAMTPTSGLQVLGALRESGILDRVPVIMFSGMHTLQSVREGYLLGARTFMLKPISPKDVMQMLTELKNVALNTRPEGYLLTPTVEARP
jgi:two-component system response regulator